MSRGVRAWAQAASGGRVQGGASRPSRPVAPRPSAERPCGQRGRLLWPLGLPGPVSAGPANRLRPSPLPWQNGANHLPAGGDSPCRDPCLSLACAKPVVSHPAKALTSWRLWGACAQHRGRLHWARGQTVSCGAGPGDQRAVGEGLRLLRRGFFPELSVGEQTTQNRGKPRPLHPPCHLLGSLETKWASLAKCISCVVRTCRGLLAAFRHR